MFFSIILENKAVEQIDMTATANKYMTSKVEGLSTPPGTISTSTYNRDYFVGDYMTVEHKRFGMIKPCIQLIAMIEGFDQNSRSLTPTFKEA